MSAYTIKRRIEEMAEDIEDQVIIMVINIQFYSIQLDESTDVSNKALLLCFVRIEYEGELQEELLCSLNLPGGTTSSEIFEALNSYFLEHGIEWKKCIGICTDGAANIVGRLSGIVAKVKNVGHPEILSTHCIHCTHCKLKVTHYNILNIISKSKSVNLIYFNCSTYLEYNLNLNIDLKIEGLSQK